MKILLIGTSFFGYIERIHEHLLRVGYAVDLMYDFTDNLKTRTIKFISPNDNYSSIKEIYFDNLLKTLVGKKYDVILVIGGRNLSISFLNGLREKYQYSKFVLYLTADLATSYYNTNYFSFFDKIYTYSRIEANKNGFEYIPFFYTNTLRIKKTIDLSFIGTLHTDRLSIIKKMIERNSSSNISLHMYCDIINFLKNPTYYTSFKIIKFKSLNFNKYIEILSSSVATLEIPDTKQENITTRPIECLGTATKIITRSKAIQDYDFFNEDNVYIYESEDDLKLKEWFRVPYKEYSVDLLNEYSINSWIKNILK